MGLVIILKKTKKKRNNLLWRDMTHNKLGKVDELKKANSRGFLLVRSYLTYVNSYSFSLQPLIRIVFLLYAISTTASTKGPHGIFCR